MSLLHALKSQDELRHANGRASAQGLRIPNQNTGGGVSPVAEFLFLNWVHFFPE